MYHTLVGIIWLLAAVVGATGLRAVHRQSQRACKEQALALRDSPAIVMLLLRLLVAGGLFGFGLAMLLDRWLGRWGVLLAALFCAAAGAMLYLRFAPTAEEEGT